MTTKRLGRIVTEYLSIGHSVPERFFKAKERGGGMKTVDVHKRHLIQFLRRPLSRPLRRLLGTQRRSGQRAERLDRERQSCMLPTSSIGESRPNGRRSCRPEHRGHRGRRRDHQDRGGILVRCTSQGNRRVRQLVPPSTGKRQMSTPPPPAPLYELPPPDEYGLVCGRPCPRASTHHSLATEGKRLRRSPANRRRHRSGACGAPNLPPPLKREPVAVSRSSRSETTRSPAA